MPSFLLGLLLLVLLVFAARLFISTDPRRLAHGVKAFVAAFSALASTGLLFAGRFGLALITIAATVMAIRALRRGPEASPGAADSDGRSSTVETDWLRMHLDHTTGALDGDVRRGRFSGRSLGSLGLSDLFELLVDCEREDPRAVALLETYLDRRQPDWREGLGRQQGTDDRRGEHGPGPSSAMDEATAWSVLGLDPGASAEEIKAAHRRLMTRLHPDHGGSDYLAAQLNQAKDLLLARRS